MDAVVEERWYATREVNCFASVLQLQSSLAWRFGDYSGGPARKDAASRRHTHFSSPFSSSSPSPLVALVPLALSRSRQLTPESDPDFTRVKDAVSIQIFKIQSNVQGIQRLIDKLGTGADGPSVRTSL